MSGPRATWLHASCTDHGPTWTARRKCPKWIGPTEPRTPRLCVAISVAACLGAIYTHGPVHIYATESRRANPPVNVPDAIITDERWLVPPVSLSRVLTLSEEEMSEYQALMRYSLSGGDLSLRDRADLILIAIEMFEKRPAISVPWFTNGLRRRATVIRDYYRQKECVA